MAGVRNKSSLSDERRCAVNRARKKPGVSGPFHFVPFDARSSNAPCRGRTFADLGGNSPADDEARAQMRTLAAENGDSDEAAGHTEADAIDPALARLVEAWPTLPEATRAGIISLIQENMNQK
jgi:hypothetical protein